MAAKEGLELASENGYDRVILEVDCRGLKNLIDGKSSPLSSIGGLCFDITEIDRSFGERRIVVLVWSLSLIALIFGLTISLSGLWD
jgi:hypothetical protein